MIESANKDGQPQEPNKAQKIVQLLIFGVVCYIAYILIS